MSSTHDINSARDILGGLGCFLFSLRIKNQRQAICKLTNETCFIIKYLPAKTGAFVFADMEKYGV